MKAFLEEFARSNRRSPPQVAPDAWAILERHLWPGNIRELKNAVSGAVVLCEGEYVRPADLKVIPSDVYELQATRLQEAHEEVDRKFITRELMANHYHLSKTAEALGTDRGKLRRLMRKYGIEGTPRQEGEEAQDEDD